MTQGHAFPAPQMFPVQPAPRPTYPQAQPASFPQTWKGQPQQAAGPKPAPAPAFPQPQPKFRAKTDEENDSPAPKTQQTIALSLPPPVALGIAPVTASAASAAVPDFVDWNVTRSRLDHLGAVSFNLIKLSGGSYRMVILMPTANPGQNQMIEVAAESEAAAVATALDRAEQWQSSAMAK